MITYNNIKLVIWDLDDTFWKGTLSEGPIEAIDSNILLVKNLTERGIVNTICSKNDYELTVKKLQELGIDEYFVFKSIDWTPKGQRISLLIKDMGLRPANCLFLDDNVVNLNEAKFYAADLMIAEPSEIPQLITFCNSTEVNDLQLKRLNQYKILEKKQKAKAAAGDNLSFLYASNTQVELHQDCRNVSDRLFEMVHRTNQLNFTKNRCCREAFDKLLGDKSVNCGYATVKDRYGDYGIVGFYAIKDNQCIHFLFSCRTIGQGVEQWVYSTLGCPQLDIIEPVVNHVKPDLTPPTWINQDCSQDIDNHEIGSEVKVVFKGPCDLEIVSSYLKAANIVREFTYVGSNQASVEHHNHSVNYLRFPFLNKDEKHELLEDCIFNDKDMFSTKMYDKDTALVFISTLIEGNLGVYRRKNDGYRLAYGEWAYPLTDKRYWSQYINNEIYSGGNRFTEAWLKQFQEKYVFEGRLDPINVVENIKELLRRLSANTCVCLMMGSEMPYEKNRSLSYEKREEYHKELNALLRKLAAKESKVYLIDFNEFISSQDDFTNNINHFQRRIYFEVAQSANQIITQVTGKEACVKRGFGRWLVDTKENYYKKLVQIQFLRKVVRFVKAKLR